MDPDQSVAQPQVELHEERMHVTTRREPVEKIILRRRIVTEVRQLDVSVRREVLEVERVPISERFGDTAASADPQPPPEPGPRLVLVLSEEVPVVTLRTQPYEQVSVHVAAVTEQQQVTEVLAREVAEVDSDLTGL